MSLTLTTHATCLYQSLYNLSHESTFICLRGGEAFLTARGSRVDGLTLLIFEGMPRGGGGGGGLVGWYKDSTTKKKKSGAEQMIAHGEV